MVLIKLNSDIDAMDGVDENDPFKPRLGTASAEKLFSHAKIS